MYGESEEDIQAAFFFGELERSLNMVNSFFVGKEAELEALVQDLQKASEHPYTMEYKGDFQHFRRVYVEVAALQKYAELNKEGGMARMTESSRWGKRICDVVDNHPEVASWCVLPKVSVRL